MLISNIFPQEHEIGIFAFQGPAVLFSVPKNAEIR